LFFAGATAAAIFGCRDTTPPTAIAVRGVSPAAPSFDQEYQAEHESETEREDGHGSHLLVCGAHDGATTSVWVGTSGASIQVGNDRLIIPGGALSDSTLITATIPTDTLADIQFEPHGLHFNKDVVLVLSTSGCNVGTQAPSHVDYLDNDGNVLETLDGTFHGGSHTVTTKIHHFSSYAIAL
jgi:hypothetical protein